MNTNKLLIVLAVLVALALAPVVQAQTVLVHPTLAAAVTASQTVIPVSSATGIAVGGLIVIPGAFEMTEVMKVVAISGTNITVLRGANGTRASAHSNAAQTWVGAPERFQNGPPDIGSPCVWTAQRYMPWIDVSSGLVWTCLARSPLGVSSTWVATSVSRVTYNSIGQIW